MKTKTLLVTVIAAIAVSFLSFTYVNQSKENHLLKTPSIEGTYELVWRKLPDGTTVKPPMIMGITTFTKDVRNFNLMEVDKNGKHYSYSVFSTYKLTDKDYTETIHFGVMNDESGGKGVTYITDQTKTVPIKYDGKKLEFKSPFDPPTTTYERDKMIATAEGMFTDYWEKVK